MSQKVHKADTAWTRGYEVTKGTRQDTQSPQSRKALVTTKSYETQALTTPVSQHRQDNNILHVGDFLPHL